MITTDYSITLSAGRTDEANRVARLLDGARLAYDRVSVTNYSEPRLRYRIGGDTHTGEVIGLMEIKEVIPYILEEIGS